MLTERKQKIFKKRVSRECMFNYGNSGSTVIEISSSSTSVILRIVSPLMTFSTSSPFNVSCSTSAWASWKSTDTFRVYDSGQGRLTLCSSSILEDRRLIALSSPPRTSLQITFTCCLIKLKLTTHFVTSSSICSLLRELRDESRSS